MGPKQFFGRLAAAGGALLLSACGTLGNIQIGGPAGTVGADGKGNGSVDVRIPGTDIRLGGTSRNNGTDCGRIRVGPFNVGACSEGQPAAAKRPAPKPGSAQPG